MQITTNAKYHQVLKYSHTTTILQGNTNMCKELLKKKKKPTSYMTTSFITLCKVHFPRICPLKAWLSSMRS